MTNAQSPLSIKSAGWCVDCVFARSIHEPADVTVLAPTLRAPGLAGGPGVVLRLDVLRLMFR